MAMNSDTTTRKVVTMPKEMAQAIDDFRFEHRIKTESEAMRKLIEAGLQAYAPKPKPKKS